MKIIKILVVVIAHQLLGFLWYSKLFSQAWLSAQGKTATNLNPDNPAPYLVAIFSTVIFTIVLGFFINHLKANSAFKGAKLGLWVWLGFFFPAVATHYVFLGFPFMLVAIDAGYNLIGALLAGTILGGWKEQRPDFKTLSI